MAAERLARMKAEAEVHGALLKTMGAFTGLAHATRRRVDERIPAGTHVYRDMVKAIESMPIIQRPQRKPSEDAKAFDARAGADLMAHGPSLKKYKDKLESVRALTWIPPTCIPSSLDIAHIDQKRVWDATAPDTRVLLTIIALLARRLNGRGGGGRGGGGAPRGGGGGPPAASSGDYDDAQASGQSDDDVSDASSTTQPASGPGRPKTVARDVAGRGRGATVEDADDDDEKRGLAASATRSSDYIEAKKRKWEETRDIALKLIRRGDDVLSFDVAYAVGNAVATIQYIISGPLFDHDRSDFENMLKQFMEDAKRYNPVAMAVSKATDGRASVEWAPMAKAAFDNMQARGASVGDDED